jgi:serine/threonine-protein kinase RsbT
MQTLIKEKMPLFKEQDMVVFRSRLREFTVKIGMGMVIQTKLITAASELARNMLRYANGGEVQLETMLNGLKTGIRLTFDDKGPGIPDIKLAMQDGYSTGRSLGLGLPGAKRLVNEFDLKTEVGKGTTVTIICWKNGR